MPKKPADKLRNHPHHYYVDKNLGHYLLDYGVPFALFVLYFVFFNEGRSAPGDLIKTTGLVGGLLLALTLAIGPLARVLPFLEGLKANRKVWGVLSFLFVLVHMYLVFKNYFKGDVNRFIDFSNPRYPALGTGLAATIILFIVSITSTHTAIIKLSAGVWKAIQYTSVLALILVVIHFYLEESRQGFTLKTFEEQATFGIMLLVVFLRALIFFMPSRKPS